MERRSVSSRSAPGSRGRAGGDGFGRAHGPGRAGRSRRDRPDRRHGRAADFDEGHSPPEGSSSRRCRASALFRPPRAPYHGGGAARRSEHPEIGPAEV